ncbi:MAG: hypothetical protein KDE27_19210 [Planctomycetes bacterium]|nr:hypothetical protein [Planctomycetota bacterium]
MGRIVFAAPDIRSFHLLDRLGRELVQRGHEVDVLSLHPVEHTFWSAQVRRAVTVRASATPRDGAPLRAIAELECARLGRLRGEPGFDQAARRLEHRMARWLPALTQWLTEHRTELVLLHGARTAERRLLHFAARELGITVLWSGVGLLPHTLQLDERGVDAEASVASREPFDYRDVRNDPDLLTACLAHAVAHAEPFGLSRSEIAAPPPARRLADALRLLGDGSGAALRALIGWREALPLRREARPWSELPRPPFVAAILQAPDDERLTLDTDSAPPAVALVRAATRAADELERGLRVVAVAPERGLAARELRQLAALPGVTVVPRELGAHVAATALAAITVNDPLAVTALLAGTPVLHCGRALWQLATVTNHEPTSRFGPVLREIATADDATRTLRERFLTRLLGETHLWCSAERPDHNGILGFVGALERRLPAARDRRPVQPYRSGPAWPLSIGRDREPGR